MGNIEISIYSELTLTLWLLKNRIAYVKNQQGHYCIAIRMVCGLHVTWKDPTTIAKVASSVIYKPCFWRLVSPVTCLFYFLAAFCSAQRNRL